MRHITLVPTTSLPAQQQGNQQLVPFEADIKSYRAQLIRRVAARTPVTGEDLPVGFYRADLLPLEPPDVDPTSDADGGDDPIEQTSDPLPENAPQTSPSAGSAEARRQFLEVQALQAAYVELSYEHGFPTLPGGEPFWHKLDYEPGFAFGAFQMYLDQTKEGARELSELARQTEVLHILQHLHNREVLADEALRILDEYSILYYWRQRAKAHDLFKEAAYRHVRLQRAMSAEDHHYRLSAKLLKKVEDFIDTKTFEDGLTTKTSLEALKTAVAVQRVSVGLPAQGPLPGKEAPVATQFEAILREIAQTQATQAASTGAQGAGSKSRDLIDALLRSPDTARSMQELVIRMTQVTVGSREAPRPGRTYDQEGQPAAPVDDDGLADDIAFHKTL